jgi:hypothetical protein
LFCVDLIGAGGCADPKDVSATTKKKGQISSWPFHGLLPRHIDDTPVSKPIRSRSPRYALDDTQRSDAWLRRRFSPSASAAGRQSVYEDKVELSMKLRGLYDVILDSPVIKIAKFYLFSKLNQQIKRKILLIDNPAYRNTDLRLKNAAHRP